MSKSAGNSNLMKPWAWLAAVAAVCLVLASSTALYAINSGVRLGLPWWTAVVAPAIVYALVLPLCVPRIRLAGWTTGFLALGVLHGVLGLATTWLYANVSLRPFAEALGPAFWSFPPALVLEMVGSLLMALPFLGALAPRPAAPRVQPDTPLPRAAAPKRPMQEASAANEQSRHIWTRPTEPPAVPAAAILSAVPPPFTVVAPIVEEPPLAAPEQHVVHAAPLLGTNGTTSEIVEPSTEKVPDFRHALTELFGDPVAQTKAEVEPAPEPLPAPVDDEVMSTLSAPAEAPTRAEPAASMAAPSTEDAPPADVPPAAVAPATLEPVAPVTTGEMVRISFDRVVGQLPPGAFRVPLAQVGARLREADTLLVAQALIVPQLGEGVVQVAWEAVVEQFPAGVFAVAPAGVKERIVNGRLLLPLDEIVRQLPPDVFGASMGRGPVQVPGIESFPAPFKPLGWEQSAPAPAAAASDLKPAPSIEPVPAVVVEPVPSIEAVRSIEPVPAVVVEPVSAIEAVAEPARAADLVRSEAPPTIEIPAAAEIAGDLKWPSPLPDVIEPPRGEPERVEVFAAAGPADAGLVLEGASEAVMAVAAPAVEPVLQAKDETTAETVIRIPFDRVMAQLSEGAFRVPLGQVGARLHQPNSLLVPQALIVPQLGEGVVCVAWDVVVGQFPVEVFTGAPADVKDHIEEGRLLLPLDEIVRQLPPDVFGGAMARGPVHVPGIESFPAPFKPLGYQEPSPPPVTAPAVSTPAPPEPVMTVAELVATPAPAESLTAPADSVGARVPPEPAPEIAEPEIVAAPQPVPVAPLYEAQAFERPIPPELPVAPSPERRQHAEMVAAFMAPLNTAAFEEAHIGDFDVISVSTAGMQGSMVAAAAGRLSSVIARGMPQPIEQVTLRGLGGALVLTPVGSGWSSGTTLAVGTRPGSALARLEMLARRATRHERESPAIPTRSGAPLARLEATAPPPAVIAAAEALTIFGPLAAQSFRDPASGAVVHCLVSPATVAGDLASFACELAQAMAQNAPAEALGVFHSAVLRSGSTRVEIRPLPSAPGLALILVVGGIDTGRPGLARLQVERTAARLSVA
jgi:hypothetical protein